MSRRAGQVSSARALAGTAVLLAALGGVVLLCRGLLLPPSGPEPLPPPPPQDTTGVAGIATCPEPDELPREPIPVTSSEVIDCPALYDGRVVRYEGEAVNAVLVRGERAWVQLNDDPYGIRLGPLPAHRSTVGGNSGLPVSVPVAVARRIDRVGSHRVHGDGVFVEGVVHRADPADGGGLTIQARTAQITRQGTAFDHPVQGGRVLVAAALAVATSLLAVVTLRARRR